MLLVADLPKLLAVQVLQLVIIISEMLLLVASVVLLLGAMVILLVAFHQLLVQDVTPEEPQNSEIKAKKTSIKLEPLLSLLQTQLLKL